MSCAGNVYVRVCVCVLSLPVHPCAPKGFPLTPCQAMVCVPPCGDARAVFKNNICMQNVWIHGDNKNVYVRTRVTPAGTRPTFPPPRFAWVRVRSCVCDIRAHWLVWPCLCTYELPFACTSASVFVRAICEVPAAQNVNTQTSPESSPTVALHREMKRSTFVLKTMSSWRPYSVRALYMTCSVGLHFFAGLDELM